MTTATRGLVRYEGEIESWTSPADNYRWQDQVDTAASCLAAAALAGGMPRVHAAMGERQLARYLASQVVRRRRTSAAKLAVIMLGGVVALGVGCFIGMLA